MAKRSFASIEQLPSKRWRVRYTGPTAPIHKAPHTFAARIDAEAFAVAKRRKIDKGQWDATDDDKPEPVTFGAYAAALAGNRQVAGRPIKARTREHYQQILDDHLLPDVRPPPARRDQAEGRARLVRGDAGRPADDAQSTPTACCARSSARAVNDEIIDANPCRIVGAGRAKRVHKIRPASRSRSSACSPPRCPSGCG